jgi:3D (Asp-Asp-Asp) domain-containing protein
MEAAVLQMPNYLKLTLAAVAVCFLAGCAEQAKVTRASPAGARRMQKVRTTAYTHSERGGHRNAVGFFLSSRRVRSAASDWSRFPLGTVFRLVDTDEVYVIDDYGTALVGTETIDLYKPSRLEMRRWGVRRVDIDILEWGSEEKSLKVLAPRAKHRSVRKMIASLERKKIQPKKKA